MGYSYMLDNYMGTVASGSWLGSKRGGKAEDRVEGRERERGGVGGMGVGSRYVERHCD